jgi:hypothetical protein
LAAGGIDGLNNEKCQVLKGRKVILFPDLNAFDKWSKKARELSNLADFTVSELLESKASAMEKELWYDIADYVLKYDFRGFLLNKASQTSIITPQNPDKKDAGKLYYKREPYKGLDFLYTCPQCKSPKMFVRYIDPDTGQYFGDNIGRCNLELSCGYHLKPGKPKIRSKN